jgi:hypothetical protein
VTSVHQRVGRVAQGERLGGFIYGTIIVLSVLVAGARAYPHDARNIAGLVATTCVAFWLAHVYSHALAHSVSNNRRISFTELREIAGREWSIVEAAVPPLAALVAGALGLVSTRNAVWIAFGLGLAVLAAEGIVVARIERLGRLGTLTVVATNLGLGVLLVGLKLIVSH